MISIIIPVLNEEKTIGVLINHLTKSSSDKNISEIIVVDGGSEDNTLFEASKFSEKTKLLVLKSPKGRAKQMNFGAKKAKGTILYFLHADSLPPKDFDQAILKEIKRGNPAGCFRMQFDHSHWWLQLAGWLTQFSWRACRGGDQSQFITKNLFKEIGGYNEDFIIYEDNILINELYKRKQFVVIQKKLTTSARLYRRKGIWKLQYHFWTIYVKKFFGATPEQLYRYYKKYIAS